MKKYILIIILVQFIVLFSGCSQKCMQNKYDCTSGEQLLLNIVKGAANTTEFINKITPPNYMIKW